MLSNEARHPLTMFGNDRAERVPGIIGGPVRLDFTSEREPSDGGHEPMWIIAGHSLGKELEYRGFRRAVARERRDLWEGPRDEPLSVQAATRDFRAVFDRRRPMCLKRIACAIVMRTTRCKSVALVSADIMYGHMYGSSHENRGTPPLFGPVTRRDSKEMRQSGLAP